MKDLKNRLSPNKQARGAFFKIKRIWNSKSITKRTKLKLFKTLVVPVLPYGCQAWKMYKRDDVFHNKALIEWKDYITTQNYWRKQVGSL